MRFQFASRDQIIQSHSELVALAIAQPADSRRKSLKFHPFLRQLDPARENFIVRKHFEYQLIRAMDIRSLPRKRYPAKRPSSLAEKRAYICRDKSRKIVSILDALIVSTHPNVIAVIERYRTQFLPPDHSLHMLGHRFERTLAIAIRISLPQLRRLRHIQPLRNIAADWVVRARLVGKQIRNHSASRQLRDYVGTISYQPHGRRLAFTHGVFQYAQRFIQVVHHHIAVTALHTPLDAFRIYVDPQKRGAI